MLTKLLTKAQAIEVGRTASCPRHRNHFRLQTGLGQEGVDGESRDEAEKNGRLHVGFHAGGQRQEGEDDLVGFFANSPLAEVKPEWFARDRDKGREVSL